MLLSINRKWFISLIWLMAAFFGVVLGINFGTGYNIVDNTGFMSTKTISHTGVADSKLFIGTGELDQYVVGMSPVITTTLVSNAVMDNSGTTATFNGSIDDLNIFSQGETWFEWGYDLPGNATAVLPATLESTGNVIYLFEHFQPNRRVYYRMVSQTDGITYGEITGFRVAGSAWYTLASILPIIIIILGILASLMVMMFGGNIITALLTALLFIVFALVFSDAVLGLLFTLF